MVFKRGPDALAEKFIKLPDGRRFVNLEITDTGIFECMPL